MMILLMDDHYMQIELFVVVMDHLMMMWHLGIYLYVDILLMLLVIFF